MKRRLPLAAIVTGFIVATGLLAGPAAHADPGPAAKTPAVHRAAATSAERARIRNYWTPQRMRAAENREVRPAADWKPAAVKPGKPTLIRGAAADEPTREPMVDGPSYLGGPWTKGGRVTKTTGRVFFTLDGTDYACSGSSAPADNGSTVITAGHCVNEGPGAYATNWEFVPGYHDGQAPYGEWTATSLLTTTQWRTQGDFNYDVGFAVVGTRSGKTLRQTVGAQTVGFGWQRGEFLWSFGYPAEGRYDGETLDYCADYATNDTTGDSDDQRLDCNLTGGSSGGPWFDNFDTRYGLGVQVSVNSFGYVGESNRMYGPYFGQVIKATYRTAQSAD